MITITTATQTIEIPRLLDRETSFGETSRNSIITNATDGTVIARNYGTIFVSGKLVIKYVNKSDAEAIRRLLTRDIRFIGAFDITPNSGADIGAGEGVELTECYWDGESTTNGYIIDRGRGLKFDITIPFISTKNVSGNGGTAFRR